MALGYSYNAQGLPYQQTSYSNAAGTTVVNQDQDVYNGFGQITGEYQSVNGVVNTSTTPEVQYVYNTTSVAANGSNPTEMVYPNGRILHMGYDNNALDKATGRVDYLADDNGSGASGSHLADYNYLGLSIVLSQADGDGVTLTTALDQFGRVAEMNWLNTSTSASTDDFQYGYDRDGNVLYKNNLVNSSFSELYHANSATTGDDNTAYDSLNRLTGFSRGTLTSSGNNGSTLDTVTTPNTLAGSTQSFNLDAVGNQTATTTDGTTVSKTQNSKNELTGVGSSTLAYDHDGNTTTDASGNTLTYDAWNRMVTDSAGTTSYTFDANDRLITETHAGTTTNLYFTSQGQVIEERQAGTVTAQNVFSIDYVNALLLRDDNSTSGNLGIAGSGLGNRVYYQHDANFNVTSTISTGGAVIQRYVYTPYGVQTVLTAAWATSSASNSIYGFQGGRYDISTGMNRFGARDYNPGSGTWDEADGGYWDGPNLYRAFAANPVDKTDPRGLYPVSPFFADEEQSLIAQRDAWWGDGWHVAGDMLDHFLANSGTPYTLTAQDISEISDDEFFKGTIFDDIIERIGKFNIGKSGTKVHVANTFDHYFSWPGQMFYAFGSLKIKYDGSICWSRNPYTDGVTFSYNLDVSISKKYNFNPKSHSEFDYVFTLFNNAWTLEAMNQAAAFELKRDQVWNMTGTYTTNVVRNYIFHP